MPANKKTKSVNPAPSTFSFERADTLLFSYKIPQQVIGPRIEYLLETSAQISVYPDQGLVAVISDISFNIKADPLVQLGQIITNCVYKFRDFENAIPQNELGQHIIPQDLIQTLFSIAYSTTRGILHTRTAGMIFPPVILPIVDPADFQPTQKK